MASGVIYGSTSNQYIESKIEWSSTPNPADNTSAVTASLYYRRKNSGYSTSGTGSFTITINGVNTTSSKSLTIENEWVLAATGSTTVSHDSNGTKTIAISATGSLPPSSLTSTSCSGTVKLDTIQRASTFSLSATTLTAGTSITVTINKASSGFTHKILYSHNNSSWTTIDAGTNAVQAVTVPTSYCSHYPNSMTGTIWFRVDTYNGSTLIGSSAAKAITFKVPSYKPALTSIEASRVDGTVPASWGIYVKGKSKAQVTFTGASTSYGATIKSYTIGSVSAANNPVTTGYLNSSGTVELSGYIMDSRGQKSDVKTVTISVVDYFNPSVMSLDINRCDADGTLNEDGTYISVKAFFLYAGCDGRNSCNCRVSYRVAGSNSSYGTAYALTSNAANVIGDGDIDINSEYDARIEIYDQFSSAAPYTITYIVPVSARILNILPSGKGVAFGRLAVDEECLDARGWTGRFKLICKNGIWNADAIVAAPMGLCIFTEPLNIANNIYAIIEISSPAGYGRYLYDGKNFIILEEIPLPGYNAMFATYTRPTIYYNASQYVIGKYSTVPVTCMITVKTNSGEVKMIEKPTAGNNLGWTSSVSPT